MVCFFYNGYFSFFSCKSYLWRENKLRSNLRILVYTLKKKRNDRQLWWNRMGVFWFVCFFFTMNTSFFSCKSYRWGENKMRYDIRKNKSIMLHMKLWLYLNLNGTHTLKETEQLIFMVGSWSSTTVTLLNTVLSNEITNKIIILRFYIYKKIFQQQLKDYNNIWSKII